MNYLDTRDLYKRQCELAEEKDALKDDVAAAQEALDECTDEDAQEDLADDLNAATVALEDWEEEYQEELDELNNLESEVGREWMHGETLIPEDEFVDYTQDLAEDIGATAGDASAWLVIDWEATADGLKMDYSSCEYQGTTYLFRAS
jgi:antirestriction protein